MTPRSLSLGLPWKNKIDMRKSLSVTGLTFLLLLASTLLARADTLLVDRESPYNRIVVSQTSDGMRVLRFEPGGARQSVVKLGDPDHLELRYVQATPTAFLYNTSPQRILIVGLGGGSMPMFMHKHFPQAHIDVVDLDPEVVAVARSHFGFIEDDLLKAHVADGRAFIENAPDKYDFIFLDAFGPDSVPAALTTLEFLRSVRSALAPGGAVIANLWGRGSNRHYDSMIKTYQKVYAELGIIDVLNTGNKIVIALPQTSSLTKDDLVSRARALTKQLQLRNDLAEIVRRGYRLPGPDGRDGVVLTDAEPPR